MNFLSAIFFGVHMLRTEHISRRTEKDKLVPLLAYEVNIFSYWGGVAMVLVLLYSLNDFNYFYRFALFLFYRCCGTLFGDGLMEQKQLVSRGIGKRIQIGCSCFLGYLLCTQAYCLLVFACG